MHMYMHADTRFTGNSVQATVLDYTAISLSALCCLCLGVGKGFIKPCCLFSTSSTEGIIQRRLLGSRDSSHHDAVRVASRRREQFPILSPTRREQRSGTAAHMANEALITFSERQSPQPTVLINHCMNHAHQT